MAMLCGGSYFLPTAINLALSYKKGRKDITWTKIELLWLSILLLLVSKIITLSDKVDHKSNSLFQK